MSAPCVRAWFVILEFTCSPDEITSALAVDPSERWIAGEARRRGGRPHEESGWKLDSPLDDTHDLEVHACWLLDRLPAALDLASITPHWYAQLSFAVYVSDETPAISFSAETAGRLSRLGAGLDIDLYVLRPDTDGESH